MPCLNVMHNAVSCKAAGIARSEWCSSCRGEYVRPTPCPGCGKNLDDPKDPHSRACDREPPKEEP